MSASTAALQLDLFPVSRSLDERRSEARALARQIDDEFQRLAFARGCCTLALAEYWSLTNRAPLTTQPPMGYTTTQSRRSNNLAQAYGQTVAQQAPERAFYEIGRLYNAMLPPGFRARLGVYYTPPELTERLLDQATAAGVDWTTCRVLDPACGGGAFLAPVLRRMFDARRDQNPDAFRQELADRLCGYEIDPFAAWMTRIALDAVLASLTSNADQPMPNLIRVCDALDQTPAGDRRAAGFDLVIGNPPYGRIGLNPAQRERFRRGLYGHANLYGVFTDLALRHVDTNGIVAYVTPTSFLAGNYFKQLRTLLAAEATPVSIDFIDVRKGVFDDVLQETLLAVFRKTDRPRSARATTLCLQPGGTLLAKPASEFRLPVEPSEPWLVPRDLGQAALLKTVGAQRARLRDWGYSVSTGPLVWNRHKAQLTSDKCPACLPLIWAESITTDGRFQFRADKRNHLPYFHVQGPHDQWLVVSKPCVLLQRTTAKEQRRRLIAAELPDAFVAEHGGVVIENHVNMIRPITELEQVPPAVLTAFLNSDAADAVFRCISGSVAVSAYELEALPLPTAASLDRLHRLVCTGAARILVERECARLYGLTDA